MMGPSYHQAVRRSGSDPNVVVPPATTAAPASPYDDALPVAEGRRAITELIRQHRAVVLVGETGSGKTTQVPQYILDDLVRGRHHLSGGSEAGGGAAEEVNYAVAVTQPRRVAAISVARYVAKRRGVDLGGEVGYSVRFDDCSSRRTKLKFMTDGVLMREMLLDPLLRRYRYIVLDEAHERTLHGDFLFGLLKRLLSTRADLNIVVMSATLNAESFSKFWDRCPVGLIHGRTFPVDVFYANEPQVDYVEAAITTILQVHLEEGPGDILCFLTGQDEIEETKDVLLRRAKVLPSSALAYVVLPLYAALGPAQQMRIFEPAPPGTRKIILATNIAETSITIEGIKYVIDPGFVKQNDFNPSTGLESLTVVPVSRAQSRQRCGRAGRIESGKCFRLFREDDFDQLLENTIPEIARANLASVVLQMKVMGVDDVLTFEFMDKPADAALMQAACQLMLLGALDSDTGKPTDVGRELAKFPIDPAAAKAMVRGRELGVGLELCAIYAMLSVESVFERAGSEHAASDDSRATFSNGAGDHVTLLRVFQAYLQQARKQRLSWCHSSGINPKQMLKVYETHCQLAQILFNVDQRPIAGRMRRATAKRPRGTPSDSAPEGEPFQATDESAADTSSSGVVPSAPPFNFAAFSKSETFSNYELVRRAICSGYFNHAAFRDRQVTAKFKTVIGQQAVALHPSSVLFRRSKNVHLVVYHTVVTTSQPYMREAIVVSDDMLLEAAPALYKRSTEDSAARNALHRSVERIF